MAVKIEPKTLGDGVKWEESGMYSRKTITVASGNALATLQVVGKVTASGEYASFNPAADDGTQTAAGIMVGDVDASTAAQKGVVIERDAIVIMDALGWPDGITTKQKTAAIGQLEELGIKAATAA